MRLSVTKWTRGLGFIGLLCFAFFSHAQENQAESQTQNQSENALIRFTGIVQFTSGAVDRVDNKKSRKALTFKTPLYEGERLALGKDSVLKLVSASGCTGVLYGEPQLLTPLREKPWRIKSQKLRWICPEGTSERLSIRGTQFEVSDGEFFISESNLLVLRGKVGLVSGASTTALAPLQLYQLTEKQWLLTNPQPHPYDLWHFNAQEKAPLESHVLPKPEKPITSRWILSPIIGRASVAFDNEKLDQHDLEVMGLRLQMQRRSGPGSLILALSFREIREPGQSGWVNYTPEGATLDSYLLSVEAGHRFNHDRWWSPFIRFGAGMETPKITVHRSSTPMYHQSHKYEFYSVAAGAGVDAFYVPRAVDWLGLYASLEYVATLSLERKSRVNQSESPAPNVSARELNEPWSLTTQSVQFMLGGFLQF